MQQAVKAARCTEKKATKTVSQLQKENLILKGQLKKMLAANAKQVKKYAKASDSDSDSGSDSE